MEQEFDLFWNPIEKKGDLKRDFGDKPCICCITCRRKHEKRQTCKGTPKHIDV